MRMSDDKLCVMCSLVWSFISCPCLWYGAVVLQGSLERDGVVVGWLLFSSKGGSASATQSDVARHASWSLSLGTG